MFVKILKHNWGDWNAERSKSAQGYVEHMNSSKWHTDRANHLSENKGSLSSIAAHNNASVAHIKAAHAIPVNDPMALDKSASARNFSNAAQHTEKHNKVFLAPTKSRGVLHNATIKPLKAKFSSILRRTASGLNNVAQRVGA